jgi:hypothetical protein
MKQYLIRWIDYFTDKTMANYIEAESISKAIDIFKKSNLRYWRIIEVIEI